MMVLKGQYQRGHISYHTQHTDQNGVVLVFLLGKHHDNLSFPLSPIGELDIFSRRLQGPTEIDGFARFRDAVFQGAVGAQDTYVILFHSCSWRMGRGVAWCTSFFFHPLKIEIFASIYW
jgi:hypothetical protein